jgi:DNA invertase Pin-like site-specific DNA recombinase
VELVGSYSNKSRTTQEFRDLRERLSETKVNVRVVRKPRGPRQDQTRLDSDHLAEFEIDFRAGVPINELVRKYEIDRTTVFAHARRMGIPRRNPEISPEQVAETAGLYRSGLSPAAVGKQLGVNARTVMRRLRKGGIEIRPKNG